MIKPFCDLSALAAIIGVMARLATAATVLLSVFLRPRGLVFSAVRFALLAVSSSDEPLGRKTPSKSLKLGGVGSPLHIAVRMLWRIIAPFSPAAYQQA